MEKNPNMAALSQTAKIYTSEYTNKGLENLQLHGNQQDGFSYQLSTTVDFNPRQQKLYKYLIYGIEGVPKPELLEMTQEKKQEIITRHRKAQKVINQYKNEVVASYCDKIFGELFWNSDVAKEMIAYSKDPESLQEENTLSFRELGIKKHHVAGKLIEFGLLPVNFFQLSA